MQFPSCLSAPLIHTFVDIVNNQHWRRFCIFVIPKSYVLHSSEPAYLKAASLISELHDFVYIYFDFMIFEDSISGTRFVLVKFEEF